jgi:hypothetical protein
MIIFDHNIAETAFRESPEQSEDTTVITDLEDELKEDFESEDIVVCRACQFKITRPEERMIVNGSTQHTFANPHGIVFEITCFRDAEGCGDIGPLSDEFAWFSGYLWRIAICRQCHIHLGWTFMASSGDDRFHGLITDRLLLP